MLSLPFPLCMRSHALSVTAYSGSCMARGILATTANAAAAKRRKERAG